MQVANAVGLCGLDLNTTLTKTINLSCRQNNCLSSRIRDTNVASDNRVGNLNIQIRKIINVALISAVMELEEVGDTISSIVRISAVQQRLKCCYLTADRSAASVVRAILQIESSISIKSVQEARKIAISRRNSTLKRKCLSQD